MKGVFQRQVATPTLTLLTHLHLNIALQNQKILLSWLQLPVKNPEIRNVRIVLPIPHLPPKAADLLIQPKAANRPSLEVRRTQSVMIATIQVLL